MKTDDFVRIRVEQDADVSVKILDPAGLLLTEADALTGRVEPETIAFVAETSGVYNFRVHVLEEIPTAPWRGAVVEIERIRPANFLDRWAAMEQLALAHADLKQDPASLAVAVPVYLNALKQARLAGDVPRQAGLLYRLGVTRSRQGEIPDARKDFASALDLYHQTSNMRGVASTLNQLGRADRRLGATQDAITEYTESLRLWRSLGAEREEADVCINLGFLQHSLGRYGEALETYGRALQIYRRRNNAARQATVLNNIGGIHDALGQPEHSLPYYQEALAITRSLANKSFEADLLNNFGAAYVRQGRLQEALDSYASALDLLRDLKDERREPPVLTNLADLFVRLGSPEKSRELLVRALDLQRKSPDRRNEAVILNNLGRVSTLLGQPEDAEGFFDQALALEVQAGDRSGRAMTLLGKAALLETQARWSESRALLTEALHLAQDLGDRSAELLARASLGRLQAAQGELKTAVQIAKELGNVAEEAKAHQELARLEAAQGNLPAARGRLETALSLFESLHSDLSGDQLRTSLFTSIREAYDQYVDVLERLQRAQPEGGVGILAFEAAERARARGLLDFLGQAQIDVREGDPDLLKEERRLRSELSTKAALRAERVRQPDKAAEAAALGQELTTLSAEYQIVEARLQAGSARYAQIKQPEVRLSELQRSALDADTILLEYFLAEPRSYLWLVTPESLDSFELPGRAQIEELARRVHEQLGTLSPGGVDRQREDLEELSRILLGPVLSRLRDKRLAIVGDGALLYVPFATLPVPSRDPAGGHVPLIVEHEVVHLPSAAVLQEIRRARHERPRPTGAVALLADPVFDTSDPRTQGPGPKTDGTAELDLLGSLRQGSGTQLSRLTWSGREAELVAAEAQGKDVLLALGYKASRELATSPELARFRVVHFATHGLLDTQHPELSGLVFSQIDPQGQTRDGFLRLHDVYHLRLNADLVVLSGCETALGKSLRGEGIVGLTRGFFHAGASQVVSSLWPVRDRATAELMQRFYRAMFRDGLRPSAALRRAQVEMWSQRQWRDPYYWAAFIAQGDWQAEAR